MVLLCFLSVASGNFGKESQGHLKEAQGAGKLCRFHNGLITSIRIFGLRLSFQATPRRLCIAVIFFYWLQMVGHLALTTTRERKDANGTKSKENQCTNRLHDSLLLFYKQTANNNIPQRSPKKFFHVRQTMRFQSGYLHLLKTPML